MRRLGTGGGGSVGRIEGPEEERYGGGVGYICAEGGDAGEGGDGLEVDGDDFDVLSGLEWGGGLGRVFWLVIVLGLRETVGGEESKHLLAKLGFAVLPCCAAEFLAFNEDAGEDLRPGTGRGAEVDYPGDVFEQVEF